MRSSKKSASRPAPKKAAQKPAPHKKSAAKKAAPKKAPVQLRKGTEQMARLLEIMARLRRPGDGCPWDLEQTIDSVKPNLIEEAYEALDAMESGNRDHLAEELGDVLLQIVLQSQIASEEGSFTFADVAQGISDKLIRRHPHIFGDVKVADSKEVLRNWDAIKKTEKKARISALDGVPKHVPPLHRAYQLQKRAARVNFDWSDIKDVFVKLDEEIGELKEAVAAGDRRHVLEELGDVLFSAVNIARFVKVDPAYALELTNAKFIRRFSAVEEEIVASGRKMKDCTLAQLDEIWDRIRAADKK
ncbi:MAG: nucleoside triphosphate pyrophosphohydrolase [Opitutae bacterium]|nr:nucleoside triphosphate pyrophosphohydrolase [Opitutae bacterium]